MSNLEYTIAPNSVSIYLDEDGENVEYIGASDHRYKRVRDALVAHAANGTCPTFEDLEDLLDKHYRPEVERLNRLSGRVSYDSEAEVVLFDNDPVDSTLADYIRELVKEDHPQVNAFVKFMEKLSANPSERARNELFNWFKKLTDLGERMTIASNGNIVAYKGVRDNGEGVPVSIHAGPGIVDGVSYTKAHLPNRVGSTVEVSRSYVDDNEAIGCSRGLHAGTYSYAHGFAQGILLRVEIDPTDVVSVPRDCAFQKIRACRYVVAEVIDAPETRSVIRGYDAGWSEEEYEAWEEDGRDRRTAQRYDDQGISFEDALDIEAEGGMDSVSDWTDLGFTLPQVVALKQAGVSFDDAATDNFDSSIIGDDEDDEDEYCDSCGDYDCEDYQCEDDDEDDEPWTVGRESDDEDEDDDWSGSDDEQVVSTGTMSESDKLRAAREALARAAQVRKG